MFVFNTTVVGQGRVATTHSAPVERGACGRSPTTTSTRRRRHGGRANCPTTTEQWTANNTIIPLRRQTPTAEVSDLILIGDTFNDYIASVDVNNAICRLDSLLI